MLGPGRYLLGVVEIALLVGFAWLGASALRARLLPKLSGPPAQLASAVLASALLILTAELLGSFGLFEATPYLLGVGVAGLALRFWLSRSSASSAGGAGAGVPRGAEPRPAASTVGDAAATGPAAEAPGPATFIAFLIAIIALIHFATGAKTRLSTGMTGFDSTWYHGPFAAGFFQSGNTMDLHFIAPQFLAWFYPANGEIFHSLGMLAFGRDLLSPLLNLGWFVACLVACWCIGRPYRVAPWSLILGAIALSVPALADQAGEARNDIVGIFFLLAAVAIALNAWGAREEGERGLSTGALIVVGLAAGLAAGIKLNFLLPAGVLVVGLGAIAPRGGRWKGLAAAGLTALAGGGYWYLRNLVHSGSPMPWIHHLGPISLPAPAQALGGREAHSVYDYLGEGSVWSEWFLPDFHHGLSIFWPLLLAAALAGLVLCLRRGPDRVLPLAGLVGLATALAWLIAPTSASGPDGMPRGFESGLRYLAPALVLGLALLPATPLLRDIFARLGRARLSLVAHRAKKDNRTHRGWLFGVGVALVLLAVAIGYPVQRRYLESRYSDPTFTTPGLNAAFAWADGVSESRIATTSTRQYPLFGTDLSNHVQFIGKETAHGGFVAPATCRTWREELNKGHYDYAVTTYDRLEPGQSRYPPQARWTESPQAKPVLRKPPTVVFQLTGSLDPSACR
jgi:hypothetical protein